MKKINEFIETKVNKYYDKFDYNCATASLLTLSDFFDLELHQQVIDSALGMHGAGRYGAQCGLVEGSLLFLGIIGRDKNKSKEEIISSCNKYAEEFENKFSSLACKELRPEGFTPSQPKHLCRDLTCETIYFTISFIKNLNL